MITELFSGDPKVVGPTARDKAQRAATVGA